MPDKVLTNFLPNLVGLVDPKVEREINTAFKRLINYYNAAIQDLQSKVGTSSAQIQTIQQNPLFSGALASPLIDNATNSQIGVAAQQGNLTPADIPNLDAGKITTGTFNIAHIPIITLAKSPANILKTDVALAVTPGVFVVGGKTLIKDNNGHSVEVLTV